MRRITDELTELERQGVTGNHYALRYRHTALEHADEFRIPPQGRELYAAILVPVGVDQAGQCAKRQLLAVEGMGNQQGVARGRLDGPVIGELDGGTLRVGDGRAGQLLPEVKGQRRARVTAEAGGAELPVPLEAAAIHVNIRHQGHDEA